MFLDLNNKVARRGRMGDMQAPQPGQPADARTESLGTKTLEGVKVEGTRVTFQIPAGQIGNDDGVARRQGWGDDGMTLIATGAQPASMAALKTGQVDAWPGDLGAAIEMTESHEARVLLNFGDVVPPFVNTALYASNTLIAQHPDVLRRFLKAWYENIAWANAHKKETVAILVPILNLKPDTVGRIYDRLMPTESTDGRFNPEAMKTMPSAIVQLGILDSEPDLSAAYTEAFLPK